MIIKLNTSADHSKDFLGTFGLSIDDTLIERKLRMPREDPVSRGDYYYNPSRFCLRSIRVTVGGKVIVH